MMLGTLLVLVLASLASAKKRDVGCWNNDDGSPVLNGFLVFFDTMTNDKCEIVCEARSFRYFGTQNGNQCLCGSGYKTYGWSDGCNLPCAGDELQNCGGKTSLRVFDMDPDPLPTTTPEPTAPPTIEPPMRTTTTTTPEPTTTTTPPPPTTTTTTEEPTTEEPTTTQPLPPTTTEGKARKVMATTGAPYLPRQPEEKLEKKPAPEEADDSAEQEEE